MGEIASQKITPAMERERRKQALKEARMTFTPGVTSEEIKRGTAARMAQAEASRRKAQEAKSGSAQGNPQAGSWGPAPSYNYQNHPQEDTISGWKPRAGMLISPVFYEKLLPQEPEWNDELNGLLSPVFFENLLEQKKEENAQNEKALRDYAKDVFLFGNVPATPVMGGIDVQNALGGELSTVYPGLALGNQIWTYLQGSKEMRQSLRDSNKNINQLLYALAAAEDSYLRPEEREALEAYSAMKDKAYIQTSSGAEQGVNLSLEQQKLQSLFWGLSLSQIEEMAERHKRYQNAQITGDIRAMAQQQGHGGVGTQIGASFLSVPAKTYGDWAALLGHFMDLSTGTGQFNTFDPNSMGSALHLYKDEVRNAVAEDIRGDGGSTLRNLLANGYRGFVGALDQILGMVSYGKLAYLMSTLGTMGDTITYASANGTSIPEAIAMAVCQGGVSLATNKLTQNVLMDTGMSAPKGLEGVVWDALKTGGVRSVAGAVERELDRGVENLFLQEQSDYNRRVALEMAKGLTEEEARKAVDKALWQERGRNILSDYTNGFFSSLGMSGYAYGRAVYESWQRQVQDQVEFAQMLEVLGEDGPKTLEEFENIKYNNPEQWENLNTMKEQTIFVENAPCTTTPLKYTGFFLRPGAKHSDQFFDVGYTQDNPLQLRYDMAQQFDMNKAVDYEILEGGKVKFNIYMELGVTKKRTFRTSWRIDTPGGQPRIVTAFRNDGGKGK